VIFAGDFNAQYDTILVSCITQRKSGLIKQFMRSNSLVSINKAEICTGSNYTLEWKAKDKIKRKIIIGQYEEG
jgi:hypothetical protein